MTKRVRNRIVQGVLGLTALCITLLSSAGGASAQVILSDNLANATSGTETATGSGWLTASFGADASSPILNSITLKLANTTPGIAELDLYNDGGLQPGSLIGILTSPASYSTSLANTTFTSSGLSLAANSTYWAVLKATSCAFDWGWTSDDTGSGVGFQDTWGSTADAGTTWFTFTGFPTQCGTAMRWASTRMKP